MVSQMDSLDKGLIIQSLTMFLLSAWFSLSTNSCVADEMRHAMILMWCHPTVSCDVTRLAHVMSPDWPMWCYPTGPCDVTRLAHVMSPGWPMWCHPTLVDANFSCILCAFNILLERKIPGNHLDFFVSKMASGYWVIHGYIQPLCCVTLCRNTAKSLI